MKANELRIGNWVKYRIYDEMDTPKEYDTYSKIDAEDLLYLHQNPDDKDFKPIRLTAKILKKCKLNKSICTIPYKQVEYYTEDYDWFLTKHGNIWVVGFDYEDGQGQMYFAHNCLQYLHQLQNFYFSTKGEELEVTLEVWA